MRYSGRRTDAEKALIRQYAKTHTSKEVAYKFRFPSVNAAHIYLRRNGIRCIAIRERGKQERCALFLAWLKENCDCTLCKELKWDCNCGKAPQCKEYLNKRFSEIIG